MRHFYQVSPQKISTVLSELSNDDLSVGLMFEQQVRSSSSVPDALISQAPLAIYIETKRGGELDRNQIERHLSSIDESSKVHAKMILFGLTKTPINKATSEDIVRRAKSSKISFIPITFSDLVRSLRSVCEDHETALHDILSDYESYLESENLLQIGDILSAFPVSWTFEQNMSFGLYFEPPDRKSKAMSRFIGLYQNKRIKAIATIATVVVGENSPAGLVVSATEKGELSNDERRRIENAIAHFQFSEGKHRYYLFDKICETNFVKRTKYGMMNRRDFNLSNWLDYNNRNNYSIKEVAEGLKEESWE